MNAISKRQVRSIILTKFVLLRISSTAATVDSKELIRGKRDLEPDDLVSGVVGVAHADLVGE